MTPQQRRWLDENPAYEAVRPLPVVSMYAYTDERYLLEHGKAVKGERRLWGNLHVITADECLHTNTSRAIKVGRRYYVV